MDKNERAKVIQWLVRAVEQRGFMAPLRLMCDALAPFDVITSQLSLFVRPFAPHAWRPFVNLLSDEQSWDELRRVMHARRVDSNESS